ALIGCDGVNPMVAKWLGFKALALIGRAAVRGWINFNSNHGDEIEDDPVKMKQFVLSKHLWDLIWGNISKGKFGVLGDAFHPMTPDIGQVLVLYLEDGIVLARCLARALLTKEQSWELKKRKLIVKRVI
ncbi:monooxygenase 2, partial [Quercus suber]